MDSAIVVRNLTVRYKDKLALDSFSTEVRKGEIYGFIGPNGAGKTTTIKCLLGLHPVPKDTVLLHGLPPSNPSSRARVGFLPEEATYYRFLTPAETLNFYGEVLGLPVRVRKERIDKLLNLTGLEPYRNKPLKSLSKGTVQKIGLAQALLNEPDTLILDEPMSGLDPISRLGLRAILSDLKAEGKTIFFSSHELSEVELLCDTVAIIRSGRILRQGTLKEVLRQAGENLERFFVETVKGEKS